MLDHLQLAILSKQVYYKSEIKLGDWQRVFWSNEGGLGSAVYKNNQNEMVIAFRGADASSITSLVLNIKTIVPMLWGSKPKTLEAAKNLVEETRSQRGTLKRLLEFICTQSCNQLYLTGYSIGGVLAGLVGYELLKEKGKNYVVVTFENPGYAQYIGEQDLARYAKDFQERYFTYLTSPNLINTFNKHLGNIYRVKLKDNPNDLVSRAKYYAHRGTTCFIDDLLRLMLLVCALNALSIVFIGKPIIPFSFFLLFNQLAKNVQNVLPVFDQDASNLLAIFLAIFKSVCYRLGVHLIDELFTNFLKKNPLDGIIHELSKLQEKNNICPIEQWPGSGQYLKHKTQNLLTWINPVNHSSLLNLAKLDDLTEQTICSTPGYRQK